MLHEAREPRLFAIFLDGSARKVQWTSEFTDHHLAACDLYERALDIEAADQLPISFKKSEDGRFVAAIYEKLAANGLPEKVLYLIGDLSSEQKYCLEDFAIFVRQSWAMIKAVRMRSFQRISKVRIWRAYKQVSGWEYLNACEMDVLEALQSSKLS